MARENDHPEHLRRKGRAGLDWCRADRAIREGGLCVAERRRFAHASSCPRSEKGPFRCWLIDASAKATKLICKPTRARLSCVDDTRLECGLPIPDIRWHFRLPGLRFRQLVHAAGRWRDRCFPSPVRGPVLLSAFCRLAAICLRDVMDVCTSADIRLFKRVGIAVGNSLVWHGSWRVEGMT